MASLVAITAHDLNDAAISGTPASLRSQWLATRKTAATYVSAGCGNPSQIVP
jgi:hypothetical protein